ncbi:MAG: methylmalonyl-CoA mutase, partial [Calditrichaeota bacterium]
YIDKVDQLGGSVPAVKQKYFQNEIARSAYNYQQKIENEEEIIVGVNRFRLDKEPPQPVLEMDEQIAARQTERLRNLRIRRDNQNVTNSLKKLKDAARGNENLMPLIIDAVEKYATVGEISHALREIFGEFQE